MAKFSKLDFPLSQSNETTTMVIISSSIIIRPLSFNLNNGWYRGNSWPWRRVMITYNESWLVLLFIIGSNDQRQIINGNGFSHSHQLLFCLANDIIRPSHSRFTTARCRVPWLRLSLSCCWSLLPRLSWSHQLGNEILLSISCFRTWLSCSWGLVPGFSLLIRYRNTILSFMTQRQKMFQVCF